MLIAEEYLLLALDDTTGKPRIGGDRLEPALAGALLAELALLERIGVTPREAGWNKRGRVTITSLTPTDDPELDAALEKLAANEGKKVKDLVSEYSLKKTRLSHGVRDRLLERLAAAGLLVRTEGTVLGFIPRTTWPARDPALEDDVRRRLQSALVGGATPTERTVTLIALLQVTGLLPKVVTTEDKKALKARAKALTEGDWAAKAVKDAIDEAAAAAAGAAGGRRRRGRQLTGRPQHSGGPGGGGVRLGECGQGLVSVQPARIGYHPERGPGQELGLLTAAGPRPAEGGAVRGDAGHSDHPRPVLADELRQPPGSGPQLGGTELVGSRGRPVDEVGDAQASGHQVSTVLIGHAAGSVHVPVDDPGAAQCRVEAIAGMGEVGLRRGRPETGIDARRTAAEDRVRPGRAPPRHGTTRARPG